MQGMQVEYFVNFMLDVYTFRYNLFHVIIPLMK